MLEQLFGSKYILVRAAVHWAGHRLSHTGHQPSSLFAKKPLRSSWEIEAAQLTNFLLAARCRPPFLAGPGFWPPVTSHTCLIDFEGFWNLSRHWWSSSTVHRTLRKRTSQSLCDGLEYLSNDCAIPADIASSHKKWPDTPLRWALIAIWRGCVGNFLSNFLLRATSVSGPNNMLVSLFPCLCPS